MDVFYRTALVDFPHVDHEFEPLAVKCIWALGGIRSEPALLRLDQLARCGNELIEQQAVELLARVLAEPPSGAIRALAAKLLEQTDRIQGFLDTAFDTYHAELLDLALAAGRRLGFDSRTVEPLLGLAQVGFHQRHDEAIAALASVGSEDAVRALDELAKNSERRATATQALARMADDPALTHEVRASARAASSLAGTD